jgi:hypothetical protein
MHLAAVLQFDLASSLVRLLRVRLGHRNRLDVLRNRLYLPHLIHTPRINSVHEDFGDLTGFAGREEACFAGAVEIHISRSSI